MRRGETLSGIAARYGTTTDALARLNQLSNPDLIRIGEDLLVPDGSTAGSVGVTPGGPASHVVRAGDTLSGIAARYGISMKQVAAANGIVDGRIYAGQRLFLSPPNVAPSTGTGGAHTVTVRPGDTVWELARAHGTTVAAIAEANGLADPDRIRAGMRLELPPGAAGGGFACPVEGARFVNDWGFPRSGGRFHEGNDVFAPRGTAVRAPVAGVVHRTHGAIGGHQFKLLGDDGVHYYGTHLDGPSAEGRVARGAVIGRVGSSGNAVGGPTHLHFEVHPGGGEAVNPYPLLIAAC